jgi:hypothetical protein
MSLRSGAQTGRVPRELLQYFSHTYLQRFLALFPNAIVLAAGGKAQSRLRSVHAEFEHCSAFTRPESNKSRAQESWRRAGQAIAAGWPNAGPSRLLKKPFFDKERRRKRLLHN